MALLSHRAPARDSADPDCAANAQRAMQSELRVHHVVSSILEVSGGPAYTVPSLAIAQAAAGASVKVFSLGDGSIQHRDGVAFQAPLAAYNRLPGIDRLGLSSELNRALRAQPADIVHSHGLWQMPGVYAARAALRHRALLVVSPRGMMSDVALSYSPRVKWLFNVVLQNPVLNRVSMFHATAQSEYEDIRTLGFRQPVAVIPNGISLPGPRSEPYSAGSKTLLSLGRIHPKKGLDTLIRAWKVLEPCLPDWKLRIVGPDEAGHTEELRRLVKRFKLARVTFVGPVFGSAKWDELRSADLFVLPTRSENFAMSVAESLVVGVPVISSKGAPWEGLDIHRCGWWIDYGEDALVATLKKAMSLPAAERHLMGLNGRDWMARDFSWESIATNMVAAYHWLISGGKAPPQVQTN